MKILFPIAASAFLLLSAFPIEGGEIPLSGWKQADPAQAVPFFEIRGSGGRQNPIRRQLKEPFSGDTLFVRFRIRYDAASIDSAEENAANRGDGEFFVLWLDNLEGSEASSHSGGIPNVGIHVDAEKKNRFMVRYHSMGETFGPALKGDQEFTLVARLSKSASGVDQPFDELSLWIDPKEDRETQPDAVCRDAKALSTLSWIGFSTGGKTEEDDRVLVGDVKLATDWANILGSSAPPGLTEIPSPPPYEPPPPPAAIAKVDPQPEAILTDHWSFQPFKRPDVPKTTFSDWVRTPVDSFIAQAHEEEGLSPAPPAADAELTRRVSLVVTGLPPKEIIPSEELDSYIDELLNSQAYGERWGRHWLDVARWAESNGHQHNRNREHAWRYRDWVVNSFVDDKPFDHFLREQIAGDEVEPFDPAHVVATGFLAAARYSGNELDKDIQRNDILVDIVNTTSKAFLGLTMECAQCHDHFFDPITQWDYYNLMAFFAKGQPGDVILSEGDTATKELVENRWGIFESARSRLTESRRKKGVPEPVLVIPKSVPGGMTTAEKRTFSTIESELAKRPTSWAFYSPITSPHDLDFAPTAIRWPLPFQKDSLASVSVRFLDRGDVGSPGPIANPAWPLVFGQADADSPGSQSRLALADWLTDPDHPLTARVWVNRIWQWHFGTGLVETSGDFGIAGSAPTHPELLDWLAAELIESGWSTKHIHHLILRSNTFRQSSLFSAANANLDPGNALLWRWEPRRLEAEAIRDSVLALAGSLDTTAGGKSIPLAESDSSHRRSLYLQQRRDNLPHQQMLFDSANAITSCSKRRVSTVGLQPLWMMNNPFVQQQAEAVASKVQTEATPEDDSGSLARRLLRTIFLREPSPEEISDLRQLIADTSLEEAVVVLLNTNEFLYIP